MGSAFGNLAAELGQVLNYNIPPMLLKVFSNQSPMAMLRPLLATKQTSTVGRIARNGILDSSLYHERVKRLFVSHPASVVLFIGVEDFLRWGKFGNLDVVNGSNFIEKETEVVPFCEPGELRSVVEPNIDDAFHSCIAKEFEEEFRCRFRKADCEEVYPHAFTPFSVGTTSGSEYAMRSACKS